MIQVTEEQRRAVEARLRRWEPPPGQWKRLELVKVVSFGQEIAAIVQYPHGAAVATMFRRW